MKRQILFLATVLAAAPAAAQDIGGFYEVSGTNFDGSRYSGEAQIRALSDTTCSIAWKTGGQTSEGICMRDGNAFAASYQLGSAIGLVIYRVLPDGSLGGTWTIAGQEGSGTEVLTPR